VTATLFERDGDRYVPTGLAQGPWALGFLHGGPVCGLAAHAAEALRPDPAFVAARLVVDLHRPVPLVPLEVAAKTETASRRIALVHVSIRAEGREVSRASALFLRRAEAPERPAVGRAAAPPTGPEGLETTSLIPRDGFGFVPPGFHREVELRHVPGRPTDRPAAWIRLPMGLIDAAPASPFARAAALSDLGNAIAALAPRKGPQASYINPDTTLYLEREPLSDWIALDLDGLSETEGVGLANVALHDTRGPIGRVLSARIFNPVAR
jgi:hypothetical protein